jgi:GNAT superfamily N-acetyltransferase
MILIPTSSLLDRDRSLFDLNQPGKLHLDAALAGVTLSRVLVDDPGNPSTAILQETCYGSIYLGGTMDAAAIIQAIEILRADSEVMIGMWPGGVLEICLASFLTPLAEYDGQVSDFLQRVPPENFYQCLQIPPGCRIVPITAQIIQTYMDPGWFLGSFGTVEKALENGFGLALFMGKEYLSNAFAGPTYAGLIEIGTETAESHRGHGFATVVCANLIHLCESRGYQTYWNCNQGNLASMTLARKMGYRNEKPYRLLYWSREK